jgi:hypothetical protein
VDTTLRRRTPPSAAPLPRVSDQVIRENPASRGTETSAEVLVGPPWRMVSNAGQQQWYGGYPTYTFFTQIR